MGQYRCKVSLFKKRFCATTNTINTTNIFIFFLLLERKLIFCLLCLTFSHHWLNFLVNEWKFLFSCETFRVKVILVQVFWESVSLLLVCPCHFCVLPLQCSCRKRWHWAEEADCLHPQWSWNSLHACCRVWQSKSCTVESFMSSVQNYIYSFRKAHMHSTRLSKIIPVLHLNSSCVWLLMALSHPFKLPQCCILNSSSVGVTDDGLFSSFQGKLSRTSSFLQAVDGVMSVA